MGIFSKPEWTPEKRARHEEVLRLFDGGEKAFIERLALQGPLYRTWEFYFTSYLRATVLIAIYAFAIAVLLATVPSPREVADYGGWFNWTVSVLVTLLLAAASAYGLFRAYAASRYAGILGWKAAPAVKFDIVGVTVGKGARTPWKDIMAQELRLGSRRGAHWWFVLLFDHGRLPVGEEVPAVQQLEGFLPRKNVNAQENRAALATQCLIRYFVAYDALVRDHGDDW